ncbi:tyrosine-type recombinase/integrase [Thioclava sp.]|uniref:tyrosine-type recombinase/integrase n=1 Tax=Thioclava sp. TaxID=1933450 RepID=UPI003AA8B635
MTKLTAQYVRDLPFSLSGQTLITDDALPGFGIRVGAASKSYFAESRVKGRTRRVTIGRVDTLTLAEARRLAMKALSEMADGKDRNAELRRERAKLMTLGQAIDGWLGERRLRASTSATYRSTMSREFGDWSDMELRRITPKLFQARFAQIMDRTPAGAALAVRTFKSCWNWARADITDCDGLAILAECPADIIKAKKLMPKAKRKQTFVSDWATFFEALDGLEINSNRHHGAGEKFKVFVEILARTGMRMGEASNLKWADVDMASKTFTITADRAKNGEALTLPMSDQTYALLAGLHGRSGRDVYIWGATPYGDPRKTLRAFRLALGWPINFHDLRRSFATIATDLDLQQSKIIRLLNHASGGNVTLGYQVSKNPETLRKSVQDISDFIDHKKSA